MFLRQYRKTAVAALIAGLLIFTLPVAALADAVNDGPAPAANPADPPANPPSVKRDGSVTHLKTQ
ncbi:MAG TPA: hypothetical protein PKA28_15750 [Methylomusa anaerophila]|uniref:Uncharacterized protein n=1 Tax=Methylomusa anaerophila TaxID=1930071 RepID=A0A348AKB7_9FIRM|nr:hypothetical protein [Methylomusa anaerophila]BBB91515.1 hypothetical protein MAMMFC1_02199 [Methylomusa anaerophila]HML89895.1 hypothetical protein [Methylomusa anaerophila]HML89898.1 hypothetical protein [Methylomusa anaerophila]